MKTTFRIILWVIVAFFAFSCLRACNMGDGITQSQYNVLRIGMTFDQVESAMGFEGRELLRTDAIAVYEWNKGGSVVKCTFTNGFLSAIASDGLRGQP